jgi:hypothetical protein
VRAWKAATGGKVVGSFPMHTPADVIRLPLPDIQVGVCEFIPALRDNGSVETMNTTSGVSFQANKALIANWMSRTPYISAAPRASPVPRNSR